MSRNIGARIQKDFGFLLPEDGTGQVVPKRRGKNPKEFGFLRLDQQVCRNVGARIQTEFGFLTPEDGTGQVVPKRRDKTPKEFGF
jgi:cold shock CspA family protein